MSDSKITLEDIHIRKELRPGDIGYLIHLHGKIYSDEYGYDIGFESYVAKAFNEFYNQYDPIADEIWIAEHKGSIVGFLLLMHRPDKMAQLRFFIIEKAYRGIGLGKLLLNEFMESLKSNDYSGCYLWTSRELEAAMSIYKRHGFKLALEREAHTFGMPLIEQRYELIF